MIAAAAADDDVSVGTFMRTCGHVSLSTTQKKPQKRCVIVIIILKTWLISKSSTDLLTNEKQVGIQEYRGSPYRQADVEITTIVCYR